MSLKGIVLAGGKSSRFGTDKALARWEGTTLLERAVRILTELGLDPDVIAGPEKNYLFLARPAHPDIVPDKGPLGGLHTAFSLFPESALLVLTCDMPLLTPDVLRPLIEAHRATGKTVIFETGSARTRQPFPGIYPKTVAASAAAGLEASQLSMTHFLSQIHDLQALPEPADIGTFLNVNARIDLEGIHPTNL